jgi:hypothetical protein
MSTTGSSVDVQREQTSTNAHRVSVWREQMSMNASSASVRRVPTSNEAQLVGEGLFVKAGPSSPRATAS